MYTPQLTHDRTDHFTSRSDVYSKELFAHGMPCNVVDDRRNIIHPTDGADILVVVVVLSKLLKPRMQIPNVRCASSDSLTIKL